MKTETEGDGISSISSQPVERLLRLLKKRAEDCTNCPLYRAATQTVFGEGKASAKVMLVGEVPGDQEDLAGRPFVGPAGKLLTRCLEELGIAREKIYLTNAVKHFKWEPRGKRRLHQKPNAREIEACHPWLEEEIRLVQPRFVVALGATAAQALMGKNFRVTRDRGRKFSLFPACTFMATIHPSALLRMPSENREKELLKWKKDLREILSFL